jgi:signal transduction histidine kinase
MANTGPAENRVAEQAVAEHTGNAGEWPEFLDRLVHDMREPFRSIAVFSELLIEMAKDPIGGQGDHILGEILDGTSRAAALLDGVSGYSLALREASISSFPATALQSAFKIVVANLETQIRESNATVTGVAVPEGEQPPKLSIGLERLMQLLHSLIANSLRFRSVAPPVLRVSAAPLEDGTWAIRVEDNGIGIASENLEAVFQPFMRVEGRKYPGAGLGLSICRKIVEAHGGWIRMDSVPAGGSTCTFTLPEADG